MKLQNRDFVNMQPATKPEPLLEVLRDFLGLVLVVLVMAVLASMLKP
jgi:hypothetical protein